jgi:hypothetical protein
MTFPTIFGTRKVPLIHNLPIFRFDPTGSFPLNVTQCISNIRKWQRLSVNVPYRTVPYVSNIRCAQMSANVKKCEAHILHLIKCYLQCCPMCVPNFRCAQMSANVRKCETHILHLMKCYLECCPMCVPNIGCAQMSANVRKCETHILHLMKCYISNIECAQMSENVRKCEPHYMDLTKCYLSLTLMIHYTTVHRTFCDIPPCVRMSANVRKCQESIPHRTVHRTFSDIRM